MQPILPEKTCKDLKQHNYAAEIDLAVTPTIEMVEPAAIIP